MATDKTKIPALKNIPAKVDPELRATLESMKEAQEVRLGRRGDPKDRAVTLRELIDSGLAKELKSDPFNPDAGSPAVDFGPITEVDEDLTVPPAPTGLTASGVFTSVLLNWNGMSARAPYGNHAFTEIWRSRSNELGGATLRATTSGFSYSDEAGYNETYYYWIRYVTTAGVRGPFNNTNGAEATTLVDIGAVMEELSENISALPGYSTLTGLIEDGMEVIRSATEPTTRSGGGAIKVDDVWIETDNNNQLYLRNSGNTAWVATRDAQLVSDVSSLTTTVNTNTASISTNATAISTETTARTTAINSLTATVNTKNKSFVSVSAPADNASNDLREGDLWIDSDDDNKLYRWNDTSSSWVAVRDTSNDGKATIFTQDNVPTSGVKAGDLWFDTNDSNKQYRAMADGSDQVTAGEWEEVRDVTTQASVTTVQNAVANADGTNAGYGVAVNANGAIAGMYLMASSDGTLQENSSRSDILFEADQITIRNPNAGNNDVAPFIVLTSADANGTPAGVYIKDAMIKNAAIDTAQIADAAIETAQIGDAQITTAKIANLAVTNALIADATIDAAKIASLDADDITVGTIDSARINVDTLNVKFFANNSAKIYDHQSPTSVAVPLSVFGSAFHRGSTDFTTQSQTTGTFCTFSVANVRNNAKYQTIFSGVLGDNTGMFVEYSYNNSTWVQAQGGIQNITMAAGTFRSYVFVYSGQFTGMTSSQTTVYWRVRIATKHRSTYLSLYSFIDNTQ